MFRLFSWVSFLWLLFSCPLLSVTLGFVWIYALPFQPWPYSSIPEITWTVLCWHESCGSSQSISWSSFSLLWVEGRGGLVFFTKKPREGYSKPIAHCQGLKCFKEGDWHPVLAEDWHSQPWCFPVERHQTWWEISGESFSIFLKFEGTYDYRVRILI